MPHLIGIGICDTCFDAVKKYLVETPNLINPENDDALVIQTALFSCPQVKHECTETPEHLCYCEGNELELHENELELLVTLDEDEEDNDAAE